MSAARGCLRTGGERGGIGSSASVAVAIGSLRVCGRHLVVGAVLDQLTLGERLMEKKKKRHRRTVGKMKGQAA